MNIDEFIVNKQIEYSISLLSHINDMGIFASICGGAPRNWHFKRPAKDIDVYISYYDIEKYFDADLVKQNVFDSLENNFYNHLFSNMGVLSDLSRVKKSDYDHTIEQILSVYNSSNLDIQTQFIIWQDYKYKYNNGTEASRVNNILRSFDFGICKIGMSLINSNKSFAFFQNKAFIKDVENKTLTINMNDLCSYNNPRTLPKRLKKMREYFPGYEVDII